MARNVEHAKSRKIWDTHVICYFEANKIMKINLEALRLANFLT